MNGNVNFRQERRWNYKHAAGFE